MSDFFARCPGIFKPVIETARELIPPRVRNLVDPRFLCGVDPRFVGLHHYTLADQPDYAEWSGEWDYDRLAHACYTHIVGRQTIVFPSLDVYKDPIEVVLHEWGHLYDEATHFEFDAPESTRYSNTNRAERFAEAFSILIRPTTGEQDEWANGEKTRPFRDLVGIA